MYHTIIKYITLLLQLHYNFSFTMAKSECINGNVILHFYINYFTLNFMLYTLFI